MDFIERWFHLSPDNGSGSTEALYLGVLALLAVAIVFRHRLGDFARRCTNRFKKD